jgi:hypothetical protein
MEGVETLVATGVIDLLWEPKEEDVELRVTFTVGEGGGGPVTVPVPPIG